MDKRCLLLIIVATLFLKITLAQDVLSEFKNKFDEADKYLSEENFISALTLFLQLNDEDSLNANVNFKVGVCYLHSPVKRSKAINYLEKAVINTSSSYRIGDANEKRAPLYAWAYLAEAYQLDYNFDEAIDVYESYKLKVDPKNVLLIKDIDNSIEACKEAKKLVDAPVNIKVINLGKNINSPAADYSAVVSADESTIIFTSRRQGSTGGLLTEDDQFYEDIYISHKVNGMWETAMPIDSSINTKGHEASIALSVDGQQLFIYKDDNGDGNIYSSNLVGDKWATPMKMPATINTKSWEPSICLSADGNSLYFTSDKKGGFGGRDIYRSRKLPNGQWSLAENLGPVINTDRNEDGPFIHPDGVTLYFSSESHKSMGGFDIFYSTLAEDNTWGTPVNMGYPINTTADDIFYTPNPNGKSAYYSSFREGGFGEKDIYLIETPDAEEKSVTVFKGNITDQYGEVPKGLVITVTNNETGELIGTYTPNSKTGAYLFILAPGINYNISYDADNGYLMQSENFDVPSGTAYAVINKPVLLKQMRVGEKVILKNIFFEFNASTLKPESKTELNKLRDLLKKNYNLVVEISGHTDYKGSDEVNMRISKQRAQAVVDILVAEGIAKERLTAVGYGESQPIAINQNPDGSDNKEGMQLNRRFEFKVLSVDGKLKVFEDIKVPENLKPANNDK